MLNEKQVEEKLNKSKAPRMKKEYIESRVVGYEYIMVAPTVMICQITLDNGFSVRGESACVNSKNFDKEIGEKISFDNAFKQLWALFGFMLAENQFKKEK